MCDPSALDTGLEKFSLIGVPGLIWLPGAGMATALAEPPAGNQLTSAWLALSQRRGAAETKVEPAGELCGQRHDAPAAASTWRVRWPAGP